MDSHSRSKTVKKGQLVVLKFVSVLVYSLSLNYAIAVNYIDDNDVIPDAPPVWEYLTIYGVDSDGDNVRDDVEIWINKSFSDVNIRRALKSVSRTYHLMMISYADAVQFNKAYSENYIRKACLSFIANSTSSAHKPYLVRILEERILNNPWRSFIMNKGFNNVPSGSYRIPDVSLHMYSLACDFKIHDPQAIMDKILKLNPRYKWTIKEQQEFKDIYENPNNYDVYKLFSVERRGF